VPASLPAVRWMPRYGGTGLLLPDTSGVSISRVTPKGLEPIAINVEQVGEKVEFLVKPVSPLEPDTDYVLFGGDFCDIDGDEPAPTEVSIRTGAAAPLPTSLGTLTAATPAMKTFNVPTSSGACTASVTGMTTTVWLKLSEEAAPWDKALVLTTYVDGTPWPGGALFTRCFTSDQDADRGLTEGEHSVMIEATLPGTDLLLFSESVSITLACPVEHENFPDVDQFMVAELDNGCSVTARGALDKGAAGLWLSVAGAAALLARRVRQSRKNN
jgi:hypothetical protein